MLLGAEFVLVAVLTATLVVEVLTAPSASIASAIALTVLAVLATIWLGAIVIGAWHGRAWVRSAAIVWQVLQFAVGVGALQGALAQPAWGWPLLISAVLAVLLLVSKPVAEALRATGTRENR